MYTRLRTSIDDSTEDEDLTIYSEESQRAIRSSSRRLAFLVFPWILSATFIMISAWQWWQLQRLSSPLPPWPRHLYSPASSVVEYETVVFNSAFPNENQVPPVYFGPSSAESDNAWDLLLEPLSSEIPASQAKLLAESTSQISKDPDTFIIGLDVYHQLHCLNAIRKEFSNTGHIRETNGSDAKAHRLHMFHCIDSIRQSLMCNADLSLIHWQWHEERGKHSPNATTTHICRKWSNIDAWARAHQLREDFDPYIRVD